ALVRHPKEKSAIHSSNKKYQLTMREICHLKG
ncbi:unnamed protein product, partial [Allacma fusca]